MPPEPPVSILLVDDRPDKIMALESILVGLGQNLVLAHSGKEALRCLLRQDFAVVLLDVNMPVMDGFETAALIRQRRSSETTPIIFVSAVNDTENHLSRGYSLGAVDYILTPVVPEILRAKVSVFVDLFNKTEQVKRQGEERAEFIREQAARAAAEAGQERLALLYEEARAAREAAEAANAAKDQFLAMLSHELRTPLSPVINTVHLLEQDETVPASLRPALAMIRRNVELEARLIDDLLDLTSVSKGKVRLSLDTLDAHHLIGTSVEICRDEAAAKQLTVVMDLAADEHHLRGDAARLHQVIWNLLKNAVKFTPAGGRVTVRTRNPEAHHLRIEVADTGIGIPAELLPKIFNAFEQGSRPGQSGGLGLGLAIAKALVELHGGSLRAASGGPEAGAVFSLDFPTVKSAAAVPNPAVPTVAPDGADRLPPAATATASSQIHAAPRLLLVDDHPDTLRSMKLLLTRRGYDVSTAPDVQSALDHAAAGRFDLLISDVGLPDGSGMDLMRQLRTVVPGAESLPGIALSGYGMEEDVARSHAAGFQEHLTKPVNTQTLEAAILRLLQAARTAG